MLSAYQELEYDSPAGHLAQPVDYAGPGEYVRIWIPLESHPHAAELWILLPFI